MSIYNKIYDFCKVRNVGTIFKNDPHSPPPRVKFLMNLLDEEGIEYELDKFPVEVYKFPKFDWRKYLKFDISDIDPEFENEYDEEEESSEVYGYNLILKGSSNRMVCAHADIVNPNIDNANDNSASCINIIAIKKLMPSINAIILDGEEVGGKGSQRLSDKINGGYFGSIEWVLNLELTGKGGKYFFIGNYPGKLFDHIKSIFDCPVVETPYNDSVTLRKNGIDSVVINPIPPLPEGEKSNVKYGDKYLDFSMLFHCHNAKDTVATIDPNDMKEFVEDVVMKILK